MDSLCCGNGHGVAIQTVDIIVLAPVLNCIHAESHRGQLPIQDLCNNNNKLPIRGNLTCQFPTP